jgi:hypothetical protein
MKLNDFVADSLKQIIEGVIDAQKFAKEKGAYINPPRAYLDGDKSWRFNIDDASVKYNPYGQIVEFDIAVTTLGSTEADGQVGVLGGALGFGARVRALIGKNQEHRIKFSIPLFFPGQE